MIKCVGDEVTIYGTDQQCKDELIRLMIGYIALMAKNGYKTEDIEKFFMHCVVDAFNNLEKINEKK